VNELAQFLAYANKVFDLDRLVQGVTDQRPYPLIPTRPVLVSLLLGVVLRVDSYLALAQRTKRSRWQRLMHWPQPLSHDTFEYVAERFHLTDLRRTLAQVAKRLKANKALESCKINGLLFVSLDANEHFASRSRCCPQCCQRALEETDARGRPRRVVEYYHRYVFAQLNGPKLNVALDLEPVRPGEAEAEAALRLLGRLRRVYGPRFFDAVTVDSWYVQGPFFQALDKLGWEWVVVLKKETMDIFQEARALSRGQAPQQQFHDAARNREVQLWEVRDLRVSATYRKPVRVVHSYETWSERKITGGIKTAHPQSSDWWWIASPGLAVYPAMTVYQGGHRRWGIENKGFNELTQFYHLEHCYHHEPVAMLAQMLILLLGFVLFSAFAVLHSQALRLGHDSAKELAENLKLALEEDLPWEQWFACG
jgi:hypothetical protein